MRKGKTEIKGEGEKRLYVTAWGWWWCWCRHRWISPYLVYFSADKRSPTNKHTNYVFLKKLHHLDQHLSSVPLGLRAPWNSSGIDTFHVLLSSYLPDPLAWGLFRPLTLFPEIFSRRIFIRSLPGSLLEVLRLYIFKIYIFFLHQSISYICPVALGLCNV